MIGSVVVMVDRWLKSAQFGVNNLLGGVPRNRPPGDVGGAYPLPDLLNIYCDQEDSDTATDWNPPVKPALAVWGDSSARIELRGYPTARSVVIGCAFVTESGVDAAESNRVCEYYLRAVMMSFEAYGIERLSKLYRELNGVKVLKVNDLTDQRIVQGATVGSGKMWGFVLAELWAADTLLQSQ